MLSLKVAGSSITSDRKWRVAEAVRSLDGVGDEGVWNLAYATAVEESEPDWTLRPAALYSVGQPTHESILSFMKEIPHD